MHTEHIWPCVETLADTLDGGRDESELVLDQLERELKEQPLTERDENRRRMTVIVAQLARLEMRMIQIDGPIGAGL